MRIIIFFLFSLVGTQLLAQNVVKINQGVDFTLKNSALLCINNMDLVNEADVNMAHGDALLYFTGTGNNRITGNGILSIDRLVLSKSQGSRLILEKNINIQQAISFGLGLLDLNGRVIHLASNAILASETEASRIVGNSGYVEITRTLDAPSSANPGNLGLRITSTSNLGTTVIRRGHASQTNQSGGGNSILRYYDILPANNSNLNATLRMPYLPSELNGLDESGLFFWRSTDNFHWSFEGFTTRNTSSNYVEKTGVASFSRWTLSTLNNPLPLDFLSFEVLCGNNNGAIQLKWKTAHEENVNKFFVQASINGIHWQNLGMVTATGNGQASSEYSFQAPSVAQHLYFRVAALDFDGQVKYTEVIKQGCLPAEDMRIWPNPFLKNLTISITRTLGSVARIDVINAKGQVVKTYSETLVPGMNSIQLDLAALSPGLYTIRLEDKMGYIKSVQVIK